MKYVGRDIKTGEWIAAKEITKGIYEEIRFKTLPELNAAIEFDYYHGGTEEYLG